MPSNDADLLRRAIAGFYRSLDVTPDLSGANLDANASDVVRSEAGHQYVVLKNGDHDTLAVYRVKNDGILRRLRRWPKEIE